MQRILDLDLDFFLDGAATWRGREHDRLEAVDYPPWPLAQVFSFLRERCGLDRRLPGFVVENHGELFPLWREAIDAGLLTPPFHVTHVDAHADLGQGDFGYSYLMTSLLFEEPEHRRFPKEGKGGLEDGNYLAFAIACRWLSDLVYVHNGSSNGEDILRHYREGFDLDAPRLQLVGIRNAEELRENLLTPENLQVDHREPTVPFQAVIWDQFQADQPFDFICLARSPPFTPPESDPIFDEIRERFIDETKFV
jgi:hypothetical protein